MPSYLTLASRSAYEPPPIKGSRFIATVAPACDEPTALAVVDAARAAMPDARHHCWAYRLRDGRERSADAGEPGGTAGRPILARIAGKDLYDVVVVVSRYFGGTKLGAGGLIRAYGGAAGMALDRAEVVVVEQKVTLRAVHAYDDTNAVGAVIAAEGLHGRAEYGAEVTLTFEVPIDELLRVRDALRSATSGRVRFVEG